MTDTMVPLDLKATSFETVEPLFQELLGRSVETAAELEQWLIDRSELTSACSETAANLYISMTCAGIALGIYFLNMTLLAIQFYDFTGKSFIFNRQPTASKVKQA